MTTSSQGEAAQNIDALLQRLEELTLTEDEREEVDESSEIPEAVRYSGQDFDVEGLVRRINSGDIVVPQFGGVDEGIETAGFQRGFVWNRPQMDRFIESLLLGYPIPGIFLVKQQDKRLLVLDGQQRLVTLKNFYEGLHADRAFKLTSVTPRFVGLTYKTLPEDLRRMLDNTFIQATVVDIDRTDSSLDAVYQIFERLNSGGTQLTPHQIRVALYSGPLIELLETLNNTPAWRKLYGAKNSRIRDQELILRIIAFYLDADSYARPLKKFLNDFAKKNRTADRPELIAAVRKFQSAAEILQAGPGPRALRRLSTQVNVAQTEAVFFALMRELDKRDITPEQAAAAFESLRGNAKFSNAMTRSTADEEIVRTRLSEAANAFKAV